MLRKVVFSVALISLSLLVTANAQLPDFVSIVEDQAPAVVKITTVTRAKTNTHDPRRGFNNPRQLPDIFREYYERYGRQRESSSLGSGFIVSKDGYVLTNHHVIDGADEIVVRMTDRSEYEAEVIGTDERSDLALLKIDGKNLPVLKLAAKGTVKVGEWVLAIGSPFGLDYSVSSGIVSAIGRSIRDGEGGTYVPFIQTDVAINPGNSGGPLFNMQGEVIGINSQIYSPSGGSVGLSFAIPSDLAINVMKQLKETGTVARGWLGVGIQDVDKDLAESFGLDKPKGALISHVEDDAPGDKAGLKVGDIIVEFNGSEILTSSDLPSVVGLSTPGDEVAMQVVRSGKQRKMKVTVGTLDEGKVGANLGSGDANDLNQADLLGLVVQTLTKEQAKSLKLSGGVLVAEVEAGSPAAMARLRRGDVITLIGGSSISSIAEFEKVVGKLPAGKPVPVRIVRNGSAGFVAIQVPR